MNIQTQMQSLNLGKLGIKKLLTDQASLDVSLFGGQILSWKVGEKQILFNNPRLIMDKSKPLRAGAPICFPWFNKGASWDTQKNLTPSHGPVRAKDWQADENIDPLEFRTQAESVLGHPLEIALRYHLDGDSISIDFKVQNLAEVENLFEIALHTYFQTSRPDLARIQGLKSYEEGLRPSLPIDRIFENSANSLLVEFLEHRIQIENTGFSKSVVWNPGRDHDLADLEKDGNLPPFLCVESLSDHITLAACAQSQNTQPETTLKTQWQGRVKYQVLPLASEA